jgi:hypothetical protein
MLGDACGYIWPQELNFLWFTIGKKGKWMSPTVSMLYKLTEQLHVVTLEG